MTDYRLQALKQAISERESEGPIDLNKGGGLIPGILDENAAEKQREYLELLRSVFQKMKDGDLDPQETESTLLALTQVFHEESEDLAELCHMVGGFDDLKSAWERQNEALCGAIHSALTFFDSKNPSILDEAMAQITATMNERLPLYAKREDVEQSHEDGFGEKENLDNDELYDDEY